MNFSASFKTNTILHLVFINSNQNLIIFKFVSDHFLKIIAEHFSTLLTWIISFLTVNMSLVAGQGFVRQKLFIALIARILNTKMDLG